MVKLIRIDIGCDFMITSMTGYGQSKLEEGNVKVAVEIRSYNHRFSEIMIRMPRHIFHLEDQLKKTVQQYLHRGKVDMFITVDGEGLLKKRLEVDWGLLTEYMETATKIKHNTNIESAISMEALLLNEAIVTVKEEELKDDALYSLLLQATENALRQLLEMREREGKALFSDIIKRLEKMKNWTVSLQEYAPKVAEQYRLRLEKKMADFIGGRIEIDESRLLTEVAIFSDKANIEEELTRFVSHLQQFETIMDEGGVVGRKLDFLVQEMNREVNTIGAKANDIHISKQVVELKSEIEKIKEQVQNIE